MSADLWLELLTATGETLYMVLAAGGIAILAGLPLGVILVVTRHNHILANPHLHYLLESIVNITRSIPFIILLIALIPLTRLITGTSIGTNAAVIPLSIAAIPFFARLVENALSEVNPGLLDAGIAMGASPWQIISYILLPESLPALINSLTVTLVNLVGYSAMAGAIGGGGLGDLAIRYGYQRFETSVMLITVIILLLLVQLLQMSGDKIRFYFSQRAR